MSSHVAQPTAQLPDEAETVDALLPPAGRSLQAAQRRYLTSPSPWRARDFGRSVLLGLLGFAGIGACWYGAGGQTNLRDQVGWILASLLAVAVLVLSGVTWLVTGFREVRHGIRDLDLDKQAVFDLRDRVSISADLDSPQGGLVTAEGMSRVHRPDCLLVRGKSVQRVPNDRPPGSRPCGVCLP